MFLFYYEKVFTVMIINSAISTKRTITSRLNSCHWTQKRPWHMTLEIQVLACDRHKNVNSGTYAIRHLSFLSSCDILQQNYGLKVSLLTKIKPENSDMLYNPTHFSGPLVCWIRQVLLYMYMKSTYNSYKFSSFVVFFLFIGF